MGLIAPFLSILSFFTFGMKMFTLGHWIVQVFKLLQGVTAKSLPGVLVKNLDELFINPGTVKNSKTLTH